MLENEGYKKSEIAILYRNNFLSRRLEEELNGRGIPYVIFGGFFLKDPRLKIWWHTSELL